MGLQESLASTAVSKAEAEEEAAQSETVKAEATVTEAAKPKKAAIPPRPKATALTGPKAKELEAEAATGRPDEGWAARPGKNAASWEQRLAELAQHFPGTADDIPSRQTCIDRFKELREAGEPLRFAWTNKEHVGYALNDLKALRSVGHPDPQVRAEAAL